MSNLLQLTDLSLKGHKGCMPPLQHRELTTCLHSDDVWLPDPVPFDNLVMPSLSQAILQPGDGLFTS